MTLTIPGLPTSLARDAWWLDATPPEAAGPQERGATSRLPRIAALLLLVALADLLFWDHDLGVSTAIFALAIFAAATAGIRPRQALWRPTLLLIIAAAPVVDHVQPLSLAFLGAGLCAALVWARKPDTPAAALTALAAAFLGRLPGRWLRALNPAGAVRGLAASQGALTGPASRALIREWAFPLAGTLVFAALMMQANPVLARVLDIDIDLWTAISRAMFWTAAAVFVTPFLAPDMPAPAQLPRLGTLPLAQAGFNAGSVLRALVLFNLMIGVQSLTDLSILVGGASLPDGMTFAEYAHRGAYPLLATALLAGAFALAARPFLGEHRAIRPLLLLWLAQNMVLCGAAMLRLEQYIGAFGLTYLRIYALIWMALVAAGLGLVFWQVVRGRSNPWLFARTAMMALATLYACAFVNFAHVIAAQNLSAESTDLQYVCDLGPMAQGAVLDAIQVRPRTDFLRRAQQTGVCDALRGIRISGWQEWGFRSGRVARYSDRVDTGYRAPMKILP